VVNKLLGEEFFGHSETFKVDAFMQSHKDMALAELLEYSQRKMSKVSGASMQNAK
jgi:hypothetical protein